MGVVERVSAVDAPGTTLYTVSIGEGTPVIVVHGGPGFGHYYLRPGMDILAEHFRLVYYDQRGSGRSDHGEGATGTLVEAVEDLDAVRKAVGVDQSNLLAHSFGAYVALLYAARHPDRVASLVLANPGPPFERDMREPFEAEIGRRMAQEDGEKLEAIMRSTEFERRDPEAVEEFIRTVYSPFFRDRTSIAKVDYGFTPLSAQSAVGLEEAWLKELESLDVVGSLRRVRAPTLVVHSELDAIPENFSRLLADKIPGAKFHLLRGSGHFAYAEDSEVFFPPVREFLERNAGMTARSAKNGDHTAH